jgi:hypothetical protein
MSDFHRHLEFISVASSGKKYSQHGKNSSTRSAMVVAVATATATVMTLAAMAGVKRQQSTSDGSVKGGRWT